MKSMKLVSLMAALLLSTKVFAAAGDGVVILEDSVNTQISTPASTLVAGHNGSMLFDLEVQDAVTYKLLNDGASAAGLDVIMDLGSITAGIYSAVDNDPCSVLVGLSQPSSFPLTRADASSATASCVVKKASPSNVVSMNYAIPLRATLLKSGSKVFTVTYSRSGAIGAGSAAFTDMKMRSRVLANNADATGGTFLQAAGDVIGSGIVMVDQDDIHYQIEIKADLNGAGAASHYSEALLIDITLI
jgi:hypothetical protein